MKIEINNNNETAKIISKNLHEFNKQNCEYIKLNSAGDETKSEKCNFIISDNNVHNYRYKSSLGEYINSPSELLLFYSSPKLML